MTAQRWPEDVGSVAEEAGRLLESLRRAGADAAAGAHGADAAAGAHGADAAAGAHGADAAAGARSGAPSSPGPQERSGGFTCEDPVCQWCPVCRASAFVRQLSPETLRGLAELAGFAATVLADLASVRTRQDAPEDAPEGRRE